MSWSYDEPDDRDERPQPTTCRECWAPCEAENELCEICFQRQQAEEARAARIYPEAV